LRPPFGPAYFLRVRGGRRGRLATFLGLLGAVAGLSRAAMGDGSGAADACAAAFSTGPEVVKQGHLIDGRAELRRCAASTCPPAMSSMCTDDLRKLELRIPSVVLAATDDRRRRVCGVRDPRPPGEGRPRVLQG
jgi:hypothetical protein